MTTPGQQSLNNFFQSVQYSHPRIAVEMSDDIQMVALYALGADKSPAKGAADRLRRQAWDLPPVLQQVLEGALTDLGY